ncbi:MAG TPA: hypothetical protein DEA52_05485 [Clostridiaceae bacterium]|nr:hypothetical protein [Clostridiaceae bacterium]
MRKTIVLATILLAFLVSGCSSKEEAHDPMNAFEAYHEAFQRLAYEEMYELLDQGSKAAMPKEDYINMYQSLYEVLPVETGGLESRIEVFEIHKRMESTDRGRIPVNVHLTMAQSTLSYSFDLPLVKEMNEEGKEEYRIVFSPELVLKDYDITDQVVKKPVLPLRGEIFDGEGNGLAINGEVLWVGLVPGQITEKTSLLEMLEESFDLSESYVHGRLGLSWVRPDTFVDLIKVPYERKAELDGLRSGYQGFTYRVVKERVYPYKEAAGHLTGYVGLVTSEEYKALKSLGFPEDTRVGRTGLEYFFEERLRGQMGEEIQLVAVDGTLKAVLQEPDHKGEDLHLTILMEKQRGLYQALEGDEGTGSLVNYATGDILALVSSPSYDPNRFILGMSSAEYRALEENPKKPLLNRTTRLYAPGSVVKPLVAAMALENGLYDGSETINGVGYTWQKDASWGNYYVRRLHAPGGEVDLREAMVYSDNIYFAQMALTLGSGRLLDGFRAFAVGEENQLGLGFMKAQVKGQGDLNQEILLADTGYGQGEMLVHALTLPKAYTAIANEGILTELSLLQRDRPSAERKVILKGTAEKVLSYMRSVVEEEDGTGHNIHLPGRSFAAKTGTSETGSTSGHKEIGWFSVLEEDKERPFITTMMIEGVEERGLSTYVVNKMKPFLTQYR